MVMALSLSALFGLRTYRTLVLLQSAQQLGMVETSSIRAWMTLQYVAATYKVDEDALVTRLQLPAGIDRTAGAPLTTAPLEALQGDDRSDVPTFTNRWRRATASMSCFVMFTTLEPGGSGVTWPMKHFVSTLRDEERG
jgi:hypothetical protein